jgi:hypothetical protein
MDELTDNMNELDKITLGLLLNKNQYNRYLSVTNPQKLEEEQKFLKNIEKYKMGIQNLLNDFLEDPKKQINNELNESLLDFSRTCIKYLENIDYEELPSKHCYEDEDEDEDVLFYEKRMKDNDISADSLDKISKAFWAIPKKR